MYVGINSERHLLPFTLRIELSREDKKGNLCFNRLDVFYVEYEDFSHLLFVICNKYFIVCNLPYIYYKFILLVSEFDSTFAAEFMIKDKTKIYNWKFS